MGGLSGSHEDVGKVLEKREGHALGAYGIALGSCDSNSFLPQRRPDWVRLTEKDEQNTRLDFNAETMTSLSG